MKNLKLFFTSALVMSVLVLNLTGCKEKIDLNNIDTRMKADMGLAVPVGNMLFTANDLFNGTRVKNICVDENGLFHLVDTLRLPMEKFQNPDVSKYISKMEDQFKIKNKLLEIEIPSFPPILDEDGNLQEFAKGVPLPIRFDKTIKLNDVNQNPNQVRLDEAIVKTALFNSTISTVDLGLKWEWIEQVDIVFNHQFTIEGGNTVTVYKKGDPKGGYNTAIPVQVDNFTINLMKDPDQDPSWENILDTIGMSFQFTFIVPKGQSLKVSDQSAFQYVFESKKIDYTAIYGWFNTIEQSRSRKSVSLDSIISGASNMDSLLLKLAEPSIHLCVAHHMSIPATITIDTFMTKNKSEERFATWNGNKSHKYILTNVVDPYGSMKDSVWNTIRTNQKEDSGHVDRLFEIRPDSLVFVFRTGVDASKESYPDYLQHRITNQTSIASYVALDMPFLFNDYSKMKYSGKITDVQFSKLSIDSLLKEVKAVEQGKAKNLKLYMKFENSLPFVVDATVNFLDKDSADMHLILFPGQKENRIRLSAPKMERLDGAHYGYVTEPSITTTIVDVTEQQLDTLTKAKHLEIIASLGDNPLPCSLEASSSIKLGVGLAADVEAIINPKNK